MPPLVVLHALIVRQKNTTMKETIKSPWFWLYSAIVAISTIAFFAALHTSILEQNWQEYIALVVLYPSAMFGLGAFFGPMVKTTDYHGESKAFHLVAFILVNLVQAGWILGFAPKNLVWFPFVFLAWGIGLWFHLTSDYKERRLPANK